MIIQGIGIQIHIDLGIVIVQMLDRCSHGDGESLRVLMRMTFKVILIFIMDIIIVLIQIELHNLFGPVGKSREGV